MAERGNVQGRGISNSSIALVGQYTTGLPLSTGGDSYFTTGMNMDGNVGSSQFLQTFPLTVVPNMPLAAIDGYSAVKQSEYMYIGSTSPTTLVTTGGGGPSVTTYYKMQGFYVTGAVYETWIAVGAPNNTPPSGHPLINIVVISIFSH